jgi:hypothetical protein
MAEFSWPKRVRSLPHCSSITASLSLGLMMISRSVRPFIFLPTATVAVTPIPGGSLHAERHTHEIYRTSARMRAWPRRNSASNTPRDTERGARVDGSNEGAHSLPPDSRATACRIAQLPKSAVLGFGLQRATPSITSLQSAPGTLRGEPLAWVDGLPTRT